MPLFEISDATEEQERRELFDQLPLNSEDDIPEQTLEKQFKWNQKKEKQSNGLVKQDRILHWKMAKIQGRKGQFSNKKSFDTRTRVGRKNCKKTINQAIKARYEEYRKNYPEMGINNSSIQTIGWNRISRRLYRPRSDRQIGSFSENDYSLGVYEPTEREESCEASNDEEDADTENESDRTDESNIRAEPLERCYRQWNKDLCHWEGIMKLKYNRYKDAMEKWKKIIETLTNRVEELRDDENARSNRRDKIETKIFKEVARIGHDFAFGKQPADLFTRIEDQLPVVFTLQDDVGDTPLNNAILQGHELRAIHILEILKKHCPWSLDEANTSGHTALILAPACNVSGDFVGQLLTAGCELEKYDNEGKSALTYAIENKKIQAVNVILEYVKENNKVNFLKRHENAEFTYLQTAAITNDVEGTNALLDLQDKDGKYMIDVYEKSQNKETVLEIAKTRRINEDILELIMQRQKRERFNKGTVSIRNVIAEITEKSTQEEPENEEITKSMEKWSPRIKWNIGGIVGLMIIIWIFTGSNAKAEYINVNQLQIGIRATHNRTFQQDNVIGMMGKNGSFIDMTNHSNFNPIDVHQYRNDPMPDLLTYVNHEDGTYTIIL